MFMNIMEIKKNAHVTREIHRMEDVTWRGSIESSNQGTFTSVLKKESGGGYVLSLLSDVFANEDPSSPNMLFAHHNKQLIIEEVMMMNSRDIIRSGGKRGLASWNYLVTGFASEVNFTSDLCFLRMVIPITDRLRSHFIFDSDTLKNDIKGGIRGLLTISLQNKKYHVYAVEDNGEHYLFVDSRQQIGVKEFDEACWTLIIGLAFFNGQLWQQCQYIFGYSSLEMDEPIYMQYKQLRPSLISSYSITTSNPSSWVRNRDKTETVLKELSDKALHVSNEVLSNLCNWVHTRDEHKIAVLLIIEAKSSSLLLMPAAFAIVLEGLATLFEGWFSEKTAPIQDKSKAKLLVQKMNLVIDEFKDDDSFEVEVLKKKVDAINTPTNRNRLTIPFKLLNIPLSEDDNLALNYRNYLLHGNVGLLQHDKKKIVMKETELGLRLLTLSNAIILKLVGYKGWIVNHVKTQEFGKVINEPYMRDIGTYAGIEAEVQNKLPFKLD